MVLNYLFILHTRILPNVCEVNFLKNFQKGSEMEQVVR